mmetsp:Transcript_16289/g.24825  ORF Transcript_16289/g.24825 Transcript_16289/m.24825 type:complete len:224 (-) Transcript_16289:234-905(-)
MSFVAQANGFVHGQCQRFVHHALQFRCHLHGWIIGIVLQLFGKRHQTVAHLFTSVINVLLFALLLVLIGLFFSAVLLIVLFQVLLVCNLVFVLVLVVWFLKLDTSVLFKQFKRILDGFVHVEILIVGETPHKGDLVLVFGQVLVFGVQFLVFLVGYRIVWLPTILGSFDKVNRVVALLSQQVLVFDDTRIIPRCFLRIIHHKVGLKESLVLFHHAFEIQGTVF